MKIGSHYKLTLFAVTLALLLVLASPGGKAYGQGLDYNEKEAQSVGRMLMCPVCVGTTIEQSQALIAQQMQAIVREMLAQGASQQEILDFFVERYGLSVLAAPPKSGANLLVWVLPIAGMLAALTGGFFVLRSMTSRNNGQVAAMTVPPTDLADTDLEPFLETVDRDLSLLGESGTIGSSTRASNRERDGVDNLREQQTNPEDDLESNG